MRKSFALLGLLVALSMILAACGGTQPVATSAPGQPPAATEAPSATAAPGEVRPNILRINLGTYPDTIDPQKSSFVNEIAHLKLMYMGLTTFNEKLETVPGSADWSYNDDATVLTFTLKDGMLYSDGSPLNAARFEYSLKRNINPETAGEYGSITDDILNAPEWRAGTHLDGTPACAAETCTDEEKAAFEAGLGVKASHADGSECVADDSGATYADADCNTLTVTLSHPAPYFHTIMGIWVAYPAKQENIETGGEIWWTSPVYQVGNGPFVWKVGEPFVRGLFSPNPNFVGAGIPTYDLEYRYITDTAVSFEAYKNGELDIIGSAPEDFETIKADANLTAQHMVYPGACTFVIKFGLAGKYTAPDGSTYDSPFLDPKVREAFAFAFDAESWAHDVDQDLSAATWTWIPPGFPGYDPTSPMSFDPERAKQALADSTFGGADALNALGLKLTFGDSPRNRTRSEFLAANYKDVLGVDITLDPIDTTVFTAITKDPATFPLLARQGWCADYPDQQNWLSVYWKSTTTFAQRQGYVNPEFDALVAQADQELDTAKRADLYAQAQQLMLADFPSAFGYNNLNHYLVQPWVKGIQTTPQDSDWPGGFAPWSITIDTQMQ
jgi:oligopeptide transport system substrate-binding protein